MIALGGRNALVTGAGSGIGRAIAAALVERGAHVTLADIDDEAVTQLAATLGPTCASPQARCDGSSDRR